MVLSAHLIILPGLRVENALAHPVLRLAHLTMHLYLRSEWTAHFLPIPPHEQGKAKNDNG